VGSVQCQVGRLVEIRVAEVRSPEDVVATRRLFAELLDRLGPRPVVIAADYRGLRVLDPAAAKEFLQNFKFGHSSRVERSGLLIDPERATFMMQVERLIRESESAVRKSFRRTAELEVWLSEVLTAEEQQRLRAFLRASAATVGKTR
jgi:hypothetical protein